MKNKTLAKIKTFLAKNQTTIASLLIMAVMFTGTALASGGTNAADSLWNTLRDLIGTWVTRLGMVIMFVGGVMFALGWKQEDASQKSTGINTIIAGAIATALGGMVALFFA